MKVYKLEEITSSTIMYKRNPPQFLFYIIGVVLFILVGLGIWSCYSIKTFVVKGNGLVTRESRSNIMAKVSGEIKEIYIEEGDIVKSGDVLMTFNSIEPNLQINQGKEQIDYLNARVELLKRAEKELEKGINTFKKSDNNERDFYNRLKNFEVKKKEYFVDVAGLKTDGYTEAQIEEYKRQSKNKIEALYYDTMLNLGNEKLSLESEIMKIKGQTGALNESLQEYKLIAHNNGTIHLNSPLNNGMVLQGGSLIGSISDSNEKMIIEATIPSVNRSRIKVGDEVEFVIGGINQAEYGVINGNIKSIESDVTINQETGDAYFKVKMDMDKDYLENDKGEKIGLTEGLVAETRVKYEKITYMQYFLEQIGIQFK